LIPPHLRPGAGSVLFLRQAAPDYWLQLDAPDEVNALLLDFLACLPATML
jgi:hypothetical protein